jgi:hypothetical protein
LLFCLSCIASLLFFFFKSLVQTKRFIAKRRQKKPQHRGSTTKCSSKDSINKTSTKSIMLPLNKPSKPTWTIQLLPQHLSNCAMYLCS